MEFIQLTDLHIGKNNDDEEINLDKIVKFIIKKYNDTPEKPVILITGDFVHHKIGDKDEVNGIDEYTRVKDLLKPLKQNGFEMLACPGNHDYGQGGNLFNVLDISQINFYYEPNRSRYLEKIHIDLLGEERNQADWDRFQTFFPVVTPISRGTEKVLFIGIDTMHGNVKKYLSGPENVFSNKYQGAGNIDDDQYNSLKLILESDEYRHFTKVVYMHHHLHNSFLGGIPPYHPQIKPMMNIQPKENRRMLKDLLVKHKVDLVCYGHLHSFETWPAYIPDAPTRLDDDGIKLSVCGHNVTKEIEINGYNYLKYHHYKIEEGIVSLKMVHFLR